MKKPPLSVLLGIALLWSWAWWAMAALASGTESALGFVLYLVGGLGPVMAVALALRAASRDERRSFVRRTFAVRRPCLRWWMAAVAVGVGPALAASAVGAAAGRPLTADPIEALPVLLVFLVVAVLVEEPLWRGVALDRGLERRSALAAALVIGALWAVWHLPLFFIEGTYQHSLGGGTHAFYAFFVNIAGQSVLLTWLVVAGGGWVSLAVGAHYLGNLSGELVPAPDLVWLAPAVTVAAAAVVGMVWRTGRG